LIIFFPLFSSCDQNKTRKKDQKKKKKLKSVAIHSDAILSTHAWP